MTEPMTLRARVAAPRAAVREALTDPSAMRVWLAEYAEVDLPKRYEFWGRFTPEGDAPHQRVLHVDDDTLRFAWFLGGEETTTEIRLEPEGDNVTHIALSQTHFDFQDAMTGANIRGVLQTFWSLSIANLVDYLEGRAITARCDFTSDQLRGEVVIDASRESVFDSLTDSKKATQWFGFPIDIEPQVGGRVVMGGFDSGNPPALIVDLDPARKLSIDWGPGGVTTWELADSGGKTRLSFMQSGFAGQAPYAAWLGSLSGLAELRRFHEIANWQPIWVA
jgi:uncharacterized protein YndB with AHSA1/START domain